MKKQDRLSFKTLMVAQPFAQLIIDGEKDIENRSRNCRIRGTVAVYASCSKASWRFEAVSERGYNYDSDQIDYGVILGFANIVDVIGPRARKGYQGDWHHKGSYGIWLQNIVRLKKPVPARFPNGVINWGELTGKTLDLCLSQLSAAQRKRIEASRATD